MAKWIPAWRYVPIDFNQELGVLENITQKSVFRNNIGGTQLRVRFNNLYSDDPMVISHVSLALHNRVTGRVSPAFPLPTGAAAGSAWRPIPGLIPTRSP